MNFVHAFSYRILMVVVMIGSVVETNLAKQVSALPVVLLPVAPLSVPAQLSVPPLIVVHPSSNWDLRQLTERPIREIWDHYSNVNGRHFVLFHGKNPETYFLNLSEQEQSNVWLSPEGDIDHITNVPSSDEYVLAGGNLTFCLCRTISDLITRAKVEGRTELKITMLSDAVFNEVYNDLFVGTLDEMKKGLLLPQAWNAAVDKTVAEVKLRQLREPELDQTLYIRNLEESRDDVKTLEQLLENAFVSLGGKALTIANLQDQLPRSVFLKFYSDGLFSDDGNEFCPIQNIAGKREKFPKNVTFEFWGDGNCHTKILHGLGEGGGAGAGAGEIKVTFRLMKVGDFIRANTNACLNASAVSVGGAAAGATGAGVICVQI
jgi:hypothetical protein